MGTDKKFYNSRSWRRLRLKILKRDKDECQRCKAVGKYSRAIIVHHLQELKKDTGNIAKIQNSLLADLKKRDIKNSFNMGLVDDYVHLLELKEKL